MTRVHAQDEEQVVQKTKTSILKTDNEAASICMRRWGGVMVEIGFAFIRTMLLTAGDVQTICH